MVKDVNIYESVKNCAIPQLRGKINVSEEVFEDYVENFGEIFKNLPTQVIHRDPNPGNIIVAEDKCGYDDVVKLTVAEKKAVPYVVLSNQLIALAWFEGEEKYQDIYETNKKMTEWLVSVWSELSVE